jgi:hypothetical protein
VADTVPDVATARVISVKGLDVTGAMIGEVRRLGTAAGRPWRYTGAQWLSR